MSISVCISTYGEDSWKDLAQSRARPSVEDQDCEIIVAHDTHGTIASVRNFAAEQATGVWLCFLDADDELAPGFLTAIRKAVTEGARVGGKVLLTPAVAYVINGKKQKPRFLDRGIPLSEDNFLIVGTLVQRELFMAVGGFSDYPHGFEDWSLWAKCWKAGAEVVQVPRAVYVAYVNHNSKHRVGWRDRKWQVATHERVRRELFPELYEGAA